MTYVGYTNSGYDVDLNETPQNNTYKWIIEIVEDGEMGTYFYLKNAENEQYIGCDTSYLHFRCHKDYPKTIFFRHNKNSDKMLCGYVNRYDSWNGLKIASVNRNNSGWEYSTSWWEPDDGNRFDFTNTEDGIDFPLTSVVDDEYVPFSHFLQSNVKFRRPKYCYSKVNRGKTIKITFDFNDVGDNEQRVLDFGRNKWHTWNWASGWHINIEGNQIKYKLDGDGTYYTWSRTVDKTKPFSIKITPNGEVLFNDELVFQDQSIYENDILYIGQHTNNGEVVSTYKLI